MVPPDFLVPILGTDIPAFQNDWLKFVSVLHSLFFCLLGFRLQRTFVNFFVSVMLFIDDLLSHLKFLVQREVIPFKMNAFPMEMTRSTI